jgi:hypothetical protein
MRSAVRPIYLDEVRADAPFEHQLAEAAGIREDAWEV